MEVYKKEESGVQGQAYVTAVSGGRCWGHWDRETLHSQGEGGARGGEEDVKVVHLGSEGLWQDASIPKIDTLNKPASSLKEWDDFNVFPATELLLGRVDGCGDIIGLKGQREAEELGDGEGGAGKDLCSRCLWDSEASEEASAHCSKPPGLAMDSLNLESGLKQIARAQKKFVYFCIKHVNRKGAAIASLNGRL
ncbi:hypothetical protein BDN71DRAFT_1437115 [Pleurotus eryngii]|uniref:Uncharacterized protein n=1 Tax=Pleurotus eryngii TaxID=5323 RepID=A0A9P5ZH71_PLEER|nr:hypothetical protein BDN71DRAFT_1437115 [Pleurotus eryngii]